MYGVKLDVFTSAMAVATDHNVHLAFRAEQ